MEKHFFFISLRKTLFLTATFVLLIGNTQPSYAMLGVDEELQVMQNGIVKGRIVDTNGEAVIGANVKLKGSNQELLLMWMETFLWKMYREIF